MDRGTNGIHRTAIVSVHAKLGFGIEVGPYAIIYPGVKIGDFTKIGPHTVIGAPAEKHGYFDREGFGVVIGERCIVREFATIHSGTFRPTRLDSHSIMLRGSHLGHDAIVEQGCTISCSVLVGGEARIMEGSNLGLGTCVHQRCIVGPYAMVGMNSTVTKKTPIGPFQKYAGSPARLLGPNTVGEQKALEFAIMKEEQKQKFVDRYLEAIRSKE